MPSFDVVSEVDRQELRNAIDQAQRELATRYDFKDTNSEIEQKDLVLTLRTASEDRLRALKVLLEERFVKRNISLKSLDWGKIEQATGESVRQVVTIKVGVPADKAREINKLIKGDQLRVTAKKRDDLQETMAMLRGANLDLPLQFINFRD
jgi:cyclic-di-GMP-binding protein